MAEVHNEEANQGGRSTICSAPNPSIPRPILKPIPRQTPRLDIFITPDYHTAGRKEKKTGNGVFQDLWFRVLMPSLIFGQFAAKLENKIRFGRSVGGSNKGRLAAKYRSFIPFKKSGQPPLIRLTPVYPRRLGQLGNM